MLVDAAKLLWAVETTEDLNIQFYTHRRITASERGLALGFPGTPRIRVLLPDSRITNFSPHSSQLKTDFLRDIRNSSKELRANDTLFIAFCSRGRPSDGAVFVGNLPQPETGETTGDVSWITIAEVENALKDVQKSVKIIIWLGSCHSGYWLKSKKWITYAAAAAHQESYSIPESSANLIIESYTGGTLYQQNNVASAVTYPPPGLPQFSHEALSRLDLFEAGEIGRTVITAAASVSESSGAPSRLDTLLRAFRVGVSSYAYPTSPSTTRLIVLTNGLGMPDANPC
ncbi:hypothetical protein BT96DRAFT_23648 [Gymnopus androsaceus JB14]|uniref:Peptidase C13 family protein n=1 Tax=Gymnopus androsaceus JB14 TaxID=1447944 RepID=A0A6A4IBY1_9AGAR|nr:hypothetical protein BT96DRAFT_23648 [Gymnopus androsaceus JB14]